MTLVFTAMPDDRTAQRDWLERQIVGPHLGQLVLELEALRGPGATPAPTLAAVLGDALERVLDDGLAAAEEAIPQLLQHPRLLLELQEKVLLRESPYWEKLLAADAALADAAEEAATRFRESIPDPVRPAPEPPSRVPLRRRPWFVALATAAGLFLTTFALVAAGLLNLSLWPTEKPAEGVAWGWARPGAIPEGVPAGDYYAALASAAGEWYAQKPADRAALELRLAEYRLGCSKLLAADHQPLRSLDPAEAEWLRARCRRWADRLDELRDDLEAGRKTVAQVRDALDETTRRVVLNLQSRADHVRSLAG